jgi:putrescine transport system substrate-binding protein
VAVYFLQKNPQESLLQKDGLREIYAVLSKERFAPLDEEKLLYINVGLDYIPYDLIELFEYLTGVGVVIDVFDSNEILEAKLLAGRSKYDIVFPTAWPNFARQLNTGIYQKIDKSRIDCRIFDEDIMNRLAACDEDNCYALPYQFGISGIGINEKIVDAISADAPKDSLAIIFDPIYASQLSKHRISLYESPDELFPAVLAYLGLDPESENEEDFIKASEHLKKIRPYIAKFTSYGFEDLASGYACATLSTSGDVLKVNVENKKPYIKFFAPKEGGPLWIDVVAIPSEAKHLNNIYAFLKFIFHPMVVAHVTNITSRANAVTASRQFVKQDLINNVHIYPNSDMRKKCYAEKPKSPRIEALKTRLLTKIKSMDGVGNE